MATRRASPVRALRSEAIRALSVCATLALIALAGCGPSQLERDRALFEQSLAAVADRGQVEAMRVVADIEVLRAAGVFSDSLASALAAMKANQYIQLDDQSRLARTGVGNDLITLVDYTTVEQKLLNDKVITDAQRAELRRMAQDNIAAAAEMAKGFQANVAPASRN